MLVPSATLVASDVVIVDESGDFELETGYGVYTGVYCWDMHPGANITVPLKIICGHDKPRTFEVYVTEPKPGSVEKGYTALPKECYSWITVGTHLVSAEAGETVSVPVTIVIPDDIIYVNRHDAIAFYVNDITQTGFQQIAYKPVWYITTDPVPVQEPLNLLWVGIGGAGVAVACLAVYLKRKARRKAHAKS